MARPPRRRPKLQIALLFCLVLTLFLLSVSVMYPCKHCPDNFIARSAGGLRQHHNKCEAYLKHEAESTQHRQSAAALNKTKRSKLAHRKARIHSQTPGPEAVAGPSRGKSSNDELQPMDQDFTLALDPHIPVSPGPGPSSPLPLPILEPTRPPPPQLTQAGRPMRNYRQPARYIDVNPKPLTPLDDEPEVPTAVLPRVRLIVRNRLRTSLNSFCLLREYLYRPSFDPDSFIPTEDLLCGNDTTNTTPLRPPSPTPVHRNESVEMLMNWKDSGAPTKSDNEINRLANEVLLDPNFKLEDLQGFNAARENRQNDAADDKSPYLDSFDKANIDIEVPSGSKDIPSRLFSVPGLQYRKLTAVIRAGFSSPLATKFHLSPFKLFHKSPGGEEERVFSEVYNSNAFIEENDKIQRAPVPPDEPLADCKLEKAVAALMFWSDGTHLANFGTAKQALANLHAFW
ncbi:hypothetical protein BDZ97DRAFT_1923519 [Flammula alnicola]|nr:hypothetical protein BDZ97DRAFT_1923519 [Flammula alnicola]